MLHQKQASICLVQSVAPSKDQIAGDHSRPNVVRTIRSLLEPSAETGSTRLYDSLGNQSPPIVLVPEYALGSGDWDEVDALVRGYPGPLVLITGFGATTRDRLAQWSNGQTPHSPTVRRLAEDLLPDHIYNGGWVWIKATTASAPECIAFVKGHQEQNTEVVELEIASGAVTPIIKFNDLMIIPAICADLLCSLSDGPKSRILDAVNGQAEKPALVLGSLLQDLKPGAIEAWQGSITELCTAGAMVVLANHAQDQPDRDEQKDSWRAISGAYVQGSAGLACQSSKGTRHVAAGAITGMVVRRTHANVTFGNLGLPPYGATSGKHLWPSNIQIAVTADGTLGPPLHAHDEYDYELGRLIKRLQLPNPSDPLLSKGIEVILDHLGTPHTPRGQSLVAKGLEGITQVTALVSADQLPSVEAALSRVIYTASFLLASTQVHWQPDDNLAGQLKWADGKGHLLVWYDRQRHPRVVELALMAFASAGGSHPPLHVIVTTADGDVTPGPVVPDRRADWTKPDEKKDRGFIAAQGVRKVAVSPMSEISQVYQTPNISSQPQEALIAALRNKL